MMNILTIQYLDLLASAYDFSTEGKVNEAILTFTIDENYYNEANRKIHHHSIQLI